MQNCLWEEPKISEGTNHNVLTDAGAQAMFGLIFALSGSATFPVMAFGASATAASNARYPFDLLMSLPLMELDRD